MWVFFLLSWMWMWNCGVRGLWVIFECVRGVGVKEGKGVGCIGGGVMIRFVSL